MARVQSVKHVEHFKHAISYARVGGYVQQRVDCRIAEKYVLGGRVDSATLEHQLLFQEIQWNSMIHT